VEEVAQISRGMKALARELDVPVIAISQLSRGPEARPDKRPMLSDLRDSGAIEQDADVVLFLFRPEYYAPEGKRQMLKGVAELIVAKQRNGPTGPIPLYFESSYARFSCVDRRQRRAAL
jgi:replicative DNA helicase